MRDLGEILNLGRCQTCGKSKYETRAKARRAAKRFHPGEALRPYECGSFWHIGHLSPNRRRGQLFIGEASRG